MNWKELAPGLAIGGIALFAIAKLASKGGSAQPSVYNALVPTSTQTPENRDAARVSAFSTVASVGLAQVAAKEKADETNSAFELAKLRFANQLTALGSQIWHAEETTRMNNASLLDRLRLELADRQYDRELQQRAIDQTYTLAQTGQIGNQAGNILASILGALNRGQQGRSSGGMGGGTPGINPNANRQQGLTDAQRAASRNRAYQMLANIWNRNASAPLSSPDYGFLGYAQPYDLSQWDWLTGYGQQGFDYWQGSGYDPQGSVSSSFGYTDYGGIADFFGYGDVGSLLSDYGYDDINSFLADYYY